MLKAVIFDIDGVLVDSFHAHFLSWRHLGNEHGVKVTEEQFAATFGRTSRDILSSHWDKPLDERDVQRLDARKEELYREIVRADFPTMYGAERLLDDLAAAGVAIAVGSSGPPENVELVVEKLGRHRFAACVNGFDVEHGKPAPDIFLTAARRLGAEPSECVVVEDAVPGIQAAKAAGMAAVALVSTGHTRYELAAAHPDLVVGWLDELSVDILKHLAP